MPDAPVEILAMSKDTNDTTRHYHNNKHNNNTDNHNNTHTHYNTKVSYEYVVDMSVKVYEYRSYEVMNMHMA